MSELWVMGRLGEEMNNYWSLIKINKRQGRYTCYRIDPFEHYGFFDTAKAAMEYCEEKMSGKFWAVWKENGGGAPQKRHDDFESAKIEAGRLARQEGARYYILETIGTVAPVVNPVEYRTLK